MNTLMPEWLERRALTHPDQPALITDEKTWTFSALSRDADRAAHFLKSNGIKPGMRVGILSGNSASFAVMVHGISRAGAIGVPVNIRLTPPEIRSQLLSAGCSVLLADDERRAVAIEAVRDDSDLTSAQVLDINAWQDVSFADTPPSDGRQINLDDPMLILFTSGTTGRAKGATITYGNVWWSSIGSALNLGLSENDSWLLVLPLFHIGGLSILIRSVTYGIPAVLHERFDPKRANDALDRQGVSIVSIVSAMLSRMLDARGDRPYPPTFRVALIGGGPVPSPLLTRALKAQVPLVQTYGLTETASQVATLPPQEARRKAGSAGKPLMGAELMVASSPGEVGEILVRGPVVTPGYWGEKTGARLNEDGWFPTGDLGYIDDEGFLYVVSRRTDLIISGGENIYPAEIEAVLHAHSHIKEAAVVGVPDPRWGEVPVAYIVYRDANQPTPPKELDAYCRTRLASFKVPKRFFALESLPRNAGGKVLYTQLRKRARKRDREAIAPIWTHVSSPAQPNAQVDPPLLFIHGDFSTGTMSWSRQLQGLKDTRQLIVIDRRGHGHSPQEPFPYTIRQDALDVVAAINRLSPTGVGLVGHSYGAIIAIEVACLYPELVSSLFLVEPPYLTLLPDDPDVRRLAEQTRSLRLQASRLSPQDLTTQFFTNVIGKDAVRHLQSKPVWSALVNEAPRFARSQFIGEFPADRLNDLAPNIPVTLFSGGRSHPALQRLAQTLHKRLSGSRLYHFPDAGHDVQRIGEPFNEKLTLNIEKGVDNHLSN